MAIYCKSKRYIIVMAKRIVTKIGDVFCIEIEARYKCFFQYIANDFEQLNSSVIRVFKKDYPICYEPIIDEIVGDDIRFYAHTILRAGIADNIWYKVGKDSNVGDVNNIFFRNTNDEFVIPMPKVSYDWWVWKIGCESFRVGQLNDTYRKAEIGTVFHYSQIIKRITTGNYSILYPE